MDLSKIVRCAIHPAIGIARVGNSDEWFVGPEVPDRVPEPKGGYKDGLGRIKRQAARFHIYGFDKNNRVVAELTADNADISWTVHVANAKAAWYCIDGPLDLPGATAVGLRNEKLEDHRDRLIIDPGPRTIHGSGQSAVFASGRFTLAHLDNDPGTPPDFAPANVPLGSIKTDRKGHLLFIGASGIAKSPNPDKPLGSVANNNGWYDDTCDGPVKATVRLRGVRNAKPMQAKPAWIISAPPDFAPGIRAIVTLYDIVYDVAAGLDRSLKPVKVSFTRHIYPILERFCQLQWVNQGFNKQFGWGQTDFLLEPKLLTQLASPDDQDRRVRESWFDKFRDPESQQPDLTKLPDIYGDDPDEDDLAQQRLAVTKLQYKWLRRWAAGKFKGDWPGKPPRPRAKLKRIPLRKQPAALDRAALEPCVGGPFHPGCEAPWILRQPLLYKEGFRLKPRSVQFTPGDKLTPEDALAPGGPLDGSDAGDITKWMAVPWHTDTAGCAHKFGDATSPYLPTFWPARVPTHVLTRGSYTKIMDPDLPKQDRQDAFDSRQKWAEFLKGLDNDDLLAFAATWSLYGIVTRKNGPGDADFPQDIYVEEGVPANFAAAAARLHPCPPSQPDPHD